MMYVCFLSIYLFLYKKNIECVPACSQETVNGLLVDLETPTGSTLLDPFIIEATHSGIFAVSQASLAALDSSTAVPFPKGTPAGQDLGSWFAQFPRSTAEYYNISTGATIGLRAVVCTDGDSNEALEIVLFADEVSAA